MATMRERARCVQWLFETKSVTQTQRNYRTQFNKQPPSDKAIRDWQRRFPETGSVHDRKTNGRQVVSDECVERIRESFVRSPTKSTRRDSRELLLSLSMIHKVLHKRLRLCAYKVQLKPADGMAHQHFAEEMLDRIDLDVDVLKKYHVHRRGNISRLGPKENMRCGVMHDQVNGPFFLQEQTINMNTHLGFFLWGYVKSSVFRTPVNGLDALKTRIRKAISAIPADMLHRTWRELEYRRDALRATKGTHIEVY
ncbi:hypothetical protein B7P43_G02603 [Cryptotermes secundus]|uniref:DUF4817 domain-containing protein n=1 Tax=Cryptotermes secundus TaxID=105785 RepID=A0A2J7RLU9_9NEOP|nr:hypothetical protein B7P43_G02603 [Cryptotermes secundus]